jgi:hypothetical protein
MRWIPLVLAALIVACTVSSGCIETKSRSYSAGPGLVHVTVTEHTYLFGAEGFFTKTYDISVSGLGREIFSVKGITQTQLKSYLEKYSADTVGVITP